MTPGYQPAHPCVWGGPCCCASGLQNSLDSQLQAAIASFAAGDTVDGVSDLEAFIHHVSAQRGKKITAALADAWNAAAQRIINAVG